MIDKLNQIKDAAYSLLTKATPLPMKLFPAGGMSEDSGAESLRVEVTTETQLPAPVSGDAKSSVVLQLLDRYPNVDPNIITLLVEDVLAFGHVSSCDNDKVFSTEFDGVLAEATKFPNIGRPIPTAIDTILQLAKEGWKVVVYSQRASLPGGREQIVKWCGDAGISVLAVVPKIKTRWHIDPSAITFSDNWDSIYEKLHYEVPVEEFGPKVTVNAIHRRECTVKQIAGALGVRFEDLDSDIRQAHAATTENARQILQSKFREKYGLSVDLAALAATTDTTKYWMDKFASRISKLSANRIEAGDTVMVTAECRNFGDTGVVVDVQGSEVSVALDTTPVQTVAFANPTKELKLVSGRAAVTPMADDTVLLAPNTYYPRGVSAARLAKWYSRVIPAVAPTHTGKEVTALYNFDGKRFIQAGPLPFAEDKLNAAKLLTLDVVIPPITNMAAISFNPTQGYTPEMVKLAMLDILDYLSHPDLSDIRIRFGGKDNYHMVLEFSKPQQLSEVQERLASFVTAYAQDSHSANISLTPTAATNMLHIDTGATRIPALYSVNTDTGLACIPVDLMKLDSFSASQAIIGE